MSNLILTVECLAGTSVEKCCAEIVFLADKLDLMIATDFNGVRILAQGDDWPGDLVEDWKAKLRSDAS